MKQRKSIIPKTIFSVVTIFLCTGLIAFAVVAAFFWLPAKVNYHITERYSFTGVSEKDRIILGFILPKSGPYQKVENVDVSWDGELQREDHDIIVVFKLLGKGCQGCR